jgi:putative exosortase-associated protein (TIGR04073 family)
MLKKFLTLIAAALLAGCAGPESKLGRGLTNLTEFTRGGEMSRSMEQVAVFGAPDEMLTTGFIHGFDRSLERTALGAYEVVTFPIPNHAPGDYGPVMRPTEPPYPDSYHPAWLATSILSPDANLGFSGGDILPFVPGSRFRIFDN